MHKPCFLSTRSTHIPRANRPGRTSSNSRQQQSQNINLYHTCHKPTTTITPITDNNFIDAPPPTITDTIHSSPPPAPITLTNTTCPTPTTSVATSGYLPPAPSNTTTVPSTSDENYCSCAVTHHISLLGQMRVHES
ncbi:unnamed protein product [Schistocephalus solidus]|uniref:Uncharacterized protein n=1 Tax=Schistocephalus solidus TaxID=70667 RepID=A0A183SV96_SCHSO|nr:unnamed protein product [Schistocephalus solidus]